MLFPPQQLLDEIGWDNKSHGNWSEFYAVDREPESFANGSYAGLTAGYMFFLKEFYRQNTYGFTLSESFVTENHMPLFTDGINNARLHGCVENGSESFSCGSFLGSKGICSGFKDNGGYFAKSNIKTLFESKNLNGIKEIHSVNAGIPMLFDLSDTIYVDTDNQVLYCSQLFKKSDVVKV